MRIGVAYFDTHVPGEVGHTGRGIQAPTTLGSAGLRARVHRAGRRGDRCVRSGADLADVARESDPLGGRDRVVTVHCERGCRVDPCPANGARVGGYPALPLSVVFFADGNRSVLFRNRDSWRDGFDVSRIALEHAILLLRDDRQREHAGDRQFRLAIAFGKLGPGHRGAVGDSRFKSDYLRAGPPDRIGPHECRPHERVRQGVGDCGSNPLRSDHHRIGSPRRFPFLRSRPGPGRSTRRDYFHGFLLRRIPLL